MRLQPRTYAFTAVTHQRTANADLMIATLLRYRDQNKFQLHGFVVMPDHIHALFTAAESIGKIAQLIKGWFSFVVRKEYSGEVWQDGYHEHRVRDAEDFRSQLLYIENNPSRRQYADYPHTHIHFSDRLDPIPENLP